MRGLTICLLALVLLFASVGESFAKCGGGRRGGRGGRGNGALAAELRLERERLLLQQQALLLGGGLGSPGVSLVTPRLGIGLNL